MRSAIASFFALMGVTACAESGAVNPTVFETAPVTFAESVAPTALGRLAYRGGFSLSAPGLGGLSAADVDRDGGLLTAISDAGGWFRFALMSNPVGNLTDVRLDKAGGLLGTNGRPFRTKSEGDAESIARAPDGRLIVAFEAQSKVLLYPADLIGQPVAGIAPPGLGNGNTGLEAITTTADGDVFALSEGGSRIDGIGPAWIGNGTEWRATSYQLTDGFRPTGATTLPNGDLLVLERRFSFPATLRARFVRITPGQLRRDPIRGEEIARLEAPFPVDNFEAVTAYADGDGRVFIYVLSDDNFSPFQRTLLLKFEITN